MSWLPSARRSFLSQVGSGVSAAFAAALVGGTATLQAQSTGRGRPQPGRHAQDDWFDQLPGRHRLLLDTTTANGFGSALLYANNFLNSSQTGYGLKDSDSAVVIVVRHFSTVFAYARDVDEAGVPMSQRIDQRPADPAAGQDQCLQLGFTRGGAAKSRQYSRRRAQARSASCRLPAGNSAFFRWARASDRRDCRGCLQRSRRQPGRQLPHGAVRDRGTQPSARTRIYLRVSGVATHSLRLEGTRRFSSSNQLITTLICAGATSLSIRLTITNRPSGATP